MPASQFGFLPLLIPLVGAAATIAPVIMQTQAEKKAAKAEKKAVQRAIIAANIAEGERLLAELRSYGISPHIEPSKMTEADLTWLRSTASQVRSMVWRKRLIYLVLGAVGVGAVWYMAVR